MSDPGISFATVENDGFSVTSRDISHLNLPHLNRPLGAACSANPSLERLDVDAAPPSAPRWGGTRPELTPPRAAAVRDRRDYLAALAEGRLANLVLGGILTELDAEPRLVEPLALALALSLECGACDERPVALKTPLEHEHLPAYMRLLEKLAAAEAVGATAVLASYPELAAGAGIKAPRTMRRRMAELVEHGLVSCVPVFRCNKHGRTDCGYCPGASSSRVGNAYWVHPVVGRGIARARRCLSNFGQASLSNFGQASGTELSPETESLQDSVSSRESTVWKNACPPVDNSEAASPRSVSASQTVDCLAAAPADHTSLDLPDRRQGENCNTPRKAPEGGAAELEQMLAEWRQRAADGDEFARELLAERARRIMRERAYGRGGTS